MYVFVCFIYSECRCSVTTDIKRLGKYVINNFLRLLVGIFLHFFAMTPLEDTRPLAIPFITREGCLPHLSSNGT